MLVAIHKKYIKAPLGAAHSWKHVTPNGPVSKHTPSLFQLRLQVILIKLSLLIARFVDGPERIVRPHICTELECNVAQLIKAKDREPYRVVRLPLAEIGLQKGITCAI